MSSLILIPARGGSRGIPEKNIKPLGGKPLIHYTLEVAQKLKQEGTVCVSTDSREIKHVVEAFGMDVPFLRPLRLAGDQAGSYEVVLHALDFYEKQNREFDKVILLQPTSPFRTEYHVRQALEAYRPEIDMVISVKKASANPYFVLFEENSDGFLEPSKQGDFNRRQDCPEVYELNGAVYIMNVDSLRSHPPRRFKHVRKFIMDPESSMDLDTPLDWDIAECLIHKKRTG